MFHLGAEQAINLARQCLLAYDVRGHAALYHKSLQMCEAGSRDIRSRHKYYFPNTNFPSSPIVSWFDYAQ